MSNGLQSFELDKISCREYANQTVSAFSHYSWVHSFRKEHQTLAVFLSRRVGWSRCPMKTSSTGNIQRVTGHWFGEFTGHRWIPYTKASDAELFFDLRPNKRLSKQLWGWWFETPSHPLWSQCNAWQQYNSYFLSPFSRLSWILSLWPQRTGIMKR